MTKLPPKNTKSFKFKVNDSLVFYTLKPDDYIKKVMHKGFWPFKHTIFLLMDNWGNNEFEVWFWFTSKKEHDVIVEEVYVWTYGEAFINEL